MKRVTIIGGGLAGLTLGIGLRKAGVPVTIWEAGRYPRHRVCGEFISGRGPQVIERMGLLKSLKEAGAVLAKTALFVFHNAKSPVRPLPKPALCLSRFSLDALLAEQLQKFGGEFHPGERWRGETTGEGIVRASGRPVQPVEDGWRWIGLKVHARNVPLEADLEMHRQPSGYIGLSWLPGQEVNVCGLFRLPGPGRAGNSGYRGLPGSPSEPTDGVRGREQIDAAQDAPLSIFQMLRGQPSSPLHSRMSAASFDERSFCSVAGLSLRPRQGVGRNECCIGDALTMIPPATGNGMSMAFEAAEIALGPLAAWSRGELRWQEARHAVAMACDAAFRQRLAWARWLQWMMFAPFFQTRFGAVALHSEWLWRTMFARTR